MLYSVELRSLFLYCGCKGTHFFSNYQIFSYFFLFYGKKSVGITLSQGIPTNNNDILLSKLESIALIILNLQFLENLTHLLKCTDACRYKRKTKNILDEAHLVEHGFNTGRVAINEKQTE